MKLWKQFPASFSIAREIDEVEFGRCEEGCHFYVTLPSTGRKFSVSRRSWNFLRAYQTYRQRF